jgi:hypothetical protein
VVEDPYQVRNKVQGQNAAYSQTPALNYTIGRGNRSPATPSTPSYGGGAGSGPSQVSFAPHVRTTTSPPYGDEGEDDAANSSSHGRAFPPPPTSPAPPTPPTAANPFGDSSEISGVRKSAGFTDEEGEGGEDDVEEV